LQMPFWHEARLYQESGSQGMRFRLSSLRG
jgi:hypothetical protein